jgi:hypothetical protein
VRNSKRVLCTMAGELRLLMSVFVGHNYINSEANLEIFSVFHAKSADGTGPMFWSHQLLNFAGVNELAPQKTVLYHLGIVADSSFCKA